LTSLLNFKNKPLSHIIKQSQVSVYR